MATPVHRVAPPPPVKKGHVEAYEAVHSYTAKKGNELSFEEGDLLFVIRKDCKDWWLARTVSSDNVRVPIIDAARRGNLAMVSDCLNAGVSVNSLDKSGSSALHAAAQGGHISCVQRLLKDHRIDINLQNKLGDSPLHCAAVKGHDEIVKLLLQVDAKRNIKNNDGATPRALANRSSVISLIDNCDQRLSHGYNHEEYEADHSEESD